MGLIAFLCLNIPASVHSSDVSLGNPSILFDESHSEFWMDRIDGGFTSLGSELEAAEFDIQTLPVGPIDEMALAPCKVLVIACPFVPPKSFSAAEKEAVYRFVREGGGLLLVAVGWAWVMYSGEPIGSNPVNDIAHEFGVQINADAITDPKDNDGSPAVPVFSRFRPHEVTSGLASVAPDGFPSSLSVLDPSVDVLVTASNEGYSSIIPAGYFPPVAAALSYGKGRVVILGHDGFFTTLGMLGKGLYKFDNLRFTLNIFTWLAQRQAFSSKFLEILANPSVATVEAGEVASY